MIPISKVFEKKNRTKIHYTRKETKPRRTTNKKHIEKKKKKCHKVFYLIRVELNFTLNPHARALAVIRRTMDITEGILSRNDNIT